MTVNMLKLKKDFNLVMNYYECSEDEAIYEKKKLLDDIEVISLSYHAAAGDIRKLLCINDQNRHLFVHSC